MRSPARSTGPRGRPPPRSRRGAARRESPRPVGPSGSAPAPRSRSQPRPRPRCRRRRREGHAGRCAPPRDRPGGTRRAPRGHLPTSPAAGLLTRCPPDGSGPPRRPYRRGGPICAGGASDRTEEQSMTSAAQTRDGAHRRRHRRFPAVARRTVLGGPAGRAHGGWTPGRDDLGMAVELRLGDARPRRLRSRGCGRPDRRRCRRSGARRPSRGHHRGAGGRGASRRPLSSRRQAGPSSSSSEAVATESSWAW